MERLEEGHKDYGTEVTRVLEVAPAMKQLLQDNGFNSSSCLIES